MSSKSKLPLAVEGTHERGFVVKLKVIKINSGRGQFYGTPSVRIKVGSANGSFPGIILPCDSLIDDRTEAMIRTIKQEGIDQYLTGSMGSAFEPVVSCIRQFN